MNVDDTECIFYIKGVFDSLTMKCITILILCLLTLTCVGQKPNVLLIISDDLRTELNCYGVPHMVTPNLDRLAKQGILFEQAHCQQAVCSASRASFLTGLRPDSIGADYPYSVYTVEKLESDRVSIMRHFMNEGYYVRSIGKVHHVYNEDFSEPSVIYYKPTYADPHADRRPKKENPPFEHPDVSDEAYKDGLHTRDAIETLHRMKAQQKPFFLAVGYTKPHLPWNAPKRYWDLYENVDIPLAPVKERPERTPKHAVPWPPLSRYKQDFAPEKEVLPNEYVVQLKRAYAASISYMDAQVGKLLAELDALGLRDNTIVMFISDHGFHLGDLRGWGKETNFDYCTRSPWILSTPDFPTDLRSKGFVEYVDIYPTLCDLAGISSPAYLEGTSVKPLLSNPDRPWKSATFSQFPRHYPIPTFEGYSIRTRHFRYVEWRKLVDQSFITHELYNLANDPYESNNLADLPEYTKIIAHMKGRLDAGWKAALPEGISNQSNNPPAPPFEPSRY